MENAGKVSKVCWESALDFRLRRYVLQPVMEFTTIV